MKKYIAITVFTIISFQLYLTAMDDLHIQSLLKKTFNLLLLQENITFQGFYVKKSINSNTLLDYNPKTVQEIRDKHEPVLLYFSYTKYLTGRLPVTKTIFEEAQNVSDSQLEEYLKENNTKINKLTRLE